MTPARARWLAGVLGLGMLAVLAGCDQPDLPPAAALPPGAAPAANAPALPALPAVDASALKTGPANPTVPQEPSPFRFTDVVKDSGVDFVQFSGMTPEKHYPSANGSGVAMFDYDGDGKLDLYFATATLLPLGTAEKGSNRLYRNLGGGKFADVTEAAGVGFRGFCHGVAAADLDNDGDQDLILSNYGPNVLYRNNGDGTFTDVTAEAGVANSDRKVKEKDANGVEVERTLINWASGVAFLDHDNDGDLDIYVSIQGDWYLPFDDKFCGDYEKKRRLYCSPRNVRTAKDVLYRNDGGLKFTDVTDSAGLGRDDGHGFGVVACDLNDDGKIDLYVANDLNPNYLFLNKGDGTFDDFTETSGAAFDIRGAVQSGMGVDAEDVDGDGRPELFVTNFAQEYNTLYQNDGKGFFSDMTTYAGSLAPDSRPWVGWGCGLVDFDHDGWVDVFVVNGYVDDNHTEHTYAEPPLLHRNVDGRRFKLATRDAGNYFDTSHVGRGAAFGDLDDDGDGDVVVNHKDAPPAILRNDTPKGDNHWVRLKLRGTKSNRDAVGARVTIEAGGKTIHRQRKSGSSMLSSNDPRLTIGLGPAATIDTLTIRWPSGAETVMTGVAVDREIEVVEEEP